MPHVTQAEAGVLAEAVRKRVGLLVTLRDRMQRAGRTIDRAFPRVRAAEDALRSLWAELHYRSCGISRPPEKAGEDAPAGLS
jgi:hypothetical protein